MRKRVIILLMVLAAASMPILGKTPFYALSEVKPGQRGYGYTVVSGTEVKSFGVEIIGVLDNQARNRSYILVKVSGSILQDFKGIAAGMSGSPVFISNRLVGAISYAFDRSDPQFGLVTPIEDMLRLWDRGVPAEPIALAPSPLLPAGCRTAVPVLTPLLVNGSRLPEGLRLAAQRFGLDLVAAGDVLGVGAQETPPLKPGSAIAAAFSYGDYNAVSIGTVTWIDGERFLAFGHPIANLGLVDYPAAGAYIHQVIGSVDRPFKIGVPLARVGRMVQDRNAGVAGFVGEQAQTVTVKAVVFDKYSGQRRTFETSVVREYSLLRSICLAALLDAMDQTFDQYISGTVKVTLRIEGDGLDQPLVRRNTFYDDRDIATAALAEVGEALDLVVGNQFIPIILRSVSFEVNFDRRPLAAAITDVTADHKQIRPGEQVRVEVKLHPFRDSVHMVPFVFTVPANMAPGELVLTVRGGYFPQSGNDAQEQELLAQLIGADQPSSLAEELSAFADRPRNNDIILEYLPFNSSEDEEEEGVPGLEIKPILLIQGCDFVVQGQKQLILEVLANTGGEEGRGAGAA